MNFTTFIAILRARFWLILLVMVVTIGTAAVVSLIMPPSYKASTSVVVDSKSKDPVSGALIPTQLMAGYLATQVDIISSRNVAGKVVDTLKLAENPQVKADFQNATQGKGNIREWLAGNLIKNLSVEPSRESTVIDISFKSVDPNFAAVVANATARAYIDTNLELRTEPARQMAAWFETQLKQLRDNLDQAQTKLSTYQRQHGLVGADERLDVETARLGELSSQLVAAQSSSFDAASRQSGVGADVMNSGVVQQLRTDLARQEAALAQLAQNLGQNHPQYQRTKAEVDTLRAKLEAEKKVATVVATTTASATRQREANLRGALSTQKTHILDLKNKRNDLSVLIRDVENAQRIYDSAQQRFSQTHLEAQTTQTEIAILNPAIAPLAPDSPKVLLNLILATFLGTLLAVGVAFLMEMIDRRVRNPQDISELLGVQVLSVLSPTKRRVFWRKATA